MSNSGLLLLVVPGYLAATRTSFEMYPGWLLLLPGLFAQAGIAEEVLFRGYLFRHVREGRSFRQAALVASGPFVIVHLLLFLTMPWPIAVPTEAVVVFPFVWIAASAIIPLMVFFVRPPAPGHQREHRKHWLQL